MFGRNSSGLFLRGHALKLEAKNREYALLRDQLKAEESLCKVSDISNVICQKWRKILHKHNLLEITISLCFPSDCGC